MQCLDRRGFCRGAGALIALASMGGTGTTSRCDAGAARGNGDGGPPFAVPLGQRQLFLDDYGVERLEGLSRTMHAASKKGAVIRCAGDEMFVQTRMAPIWDARAARYRLWSIIARVAGPTGSGYHESLDGISWSRPALARAGDSSGRGYVYVRPAGARVECAVLNSLTAEPSRRYVGLTWLNGGAQPIASDGSEWRVLPVPPIPSSDEYNLSVDPMERIFVATVKRSGPNGRAVALSTSHDFDRWTTPEPIFHADETDQERARSVIRRHLDDPSLQQPLYNSPADHHADVYNMGVFRYEGLYLGMPSIFHHTGKIPAGNQDGFHHVQLACSRDLRRWQRLGDRAPFIAPSPVGPGVYDTMQCIGPSSPVPHGDELRFYYTGIRVREGYQGQRDMGAICLATLRRDGFVSLDAGPEEGALFTAPFRHPGGELHLNVDASGGAAIVEVLPAGDAPRLQPFTGAPIRGNHPDARVTVPPGPAPPLTGALVRLRVRLHRARLYSYWFQ